MLTALLLAASVSAPPIPLDAARRTFEETRLASEEDGGKLWGKPLYGPLMFVDPATRFTVANQADASGVLKPADGVFTGTLPADVPVANHAVTWSGVHWTMVMWGSLGRRIVSRRRLVLHECWHRIQNDLGFRASNANNPHLDTVDGRVLLQLELRALAAALRASGEERTKAIRDALGYRAARRAKFADAAKSERALEDNEGLAEYTGIALRGTTDAETRAIVAHEIEAVDPATSFVRGFAYQTGPAYGLLLDALAPGWRQAFHTGDDLGDALAAAAKVTASEPGAAAYHGAELRASEEKRDREHRELVARYRALLIDGPTLVLPNADAHYSFDPNAVVSMGAEGVVYPEAELSAQWGTLSVKDGVLVPGDYSRFVVAAAHAKDVKLAPGWKVAGGAVVRE